MLAVDLIIPTEAALKKCFDCNGQKKIKINHIKNSGAFAPEFFILLIVQFLPYRRLREYPRP